MKSRRIPASLALASLRDCAGPAFLLACLVLMPASVMAQAPTSAPSSPPKEAKTVSLADDPEVKLGRGYAEENDKHVKLITDSAILERVNRIGGEIAAVADEMPIPALYGTSVLKPFHYTFKVVDDKDVNSYSIPGGFIYVCKGLLDYVHSDDELAGVLAHEITHAMHHHVLKLIHEQNKLQNALTPVQLAAIAMILAGRSSGGSAGAGLLEGSQLYQTAKLNGYSVNAEKDADHGAILLMAHTHYNPAGLYSFMVRLASYERNHGFAGDMGILRDHPPTEERVEAAKKLLADLNLPIYVSEVDPAWRAVVKTTKVGSVELAEISVQGLSVCRVTATATMTAQARGEKLAKRLTEMLDRQLLPFEVQVSHDQTWVTARGVPILNVADASAQGKTLDALAHEMGAAVMQINQKQQLELAL
jgi:predicted Zn-dependent protease